MSTSAAFSRNIHLLAWVSLCTDMASEMLYPLMPFYLESIGITALGLGWMEGMAECLAGFGKMYFGRLSDTMGNRVGFIRWGYALSALSKPLMALVNSSAGILCIRATDRLGKGLRTGARDALLIHESIPENRGRVFGYHRAMDTAGAALGPCLALLFLWAWELPFSIIFLIAFIPGLCSIGLTFLLRDKETKPKTMASQRGFFSSTWRQMPSPLLRLMGVLTLFALINSSDLFLLACLHKRGGFTAREVIGLYMLYNGVYALASYPFGRWVDRIGPKFIFLVGLLFFAITYAWIGFIQDGLQAAICLSIYGLYAACTDGVSKAWLASWCPPEHKGWLMGTMQGISSIGALLASVMAGYIMVEWNMQTAFTLAAALTGFVMFLLFFIPQPRPDSKHVA